MITFFSQEVRSQPSQDINPFRFTVSEFKFTPNRSSSKATFKIKQRPNTQVHRQCLTSQQITRSTSYKGDEVREQDKFINGSLFLLPEEKTADNRQKMFMIQKQRSNSSKKLYVPTDKIIEEVRKNHFSQFPQRSKSEKKMSPLKVDIDLRRKKHLATARKIHRSPMQLLTRKLEWQGKEIRKLVPFVNQSKPHKISMTGFARTIKDISPKKVFIPSLSGWESHQEDEFIFAENHLF